MPFSSVRNQLYDCTLRAEVSPLKKKLTKLKEAVIVKRILDLNLRGFPPIKAILYDIANKPLAKRDASIIDKNWLDNFISRKEELKIY